MIIKMSDVDAKTQPSDPISIIRSLLEDVLRQVIAGETLPLKRFSKYNSHKEDDFRNASSQIYIINRLNNSSAMKYQTEFSSSVKHHINKKTGCAHKCDQYYKNEDVLSSDINATDDSYRIKSSPLNSKLSHLPEEPSETASVHYLDYKRRGLFIRDTLYSNNEGKIVDVRATLTKSEILDWVHDRFQHLLADELNANNWEVRFRKLETNTEAQRNRHREQEKTLTNLENTSKEGGNRHIGCQTNLGSGSLFNALAVNNLFAARRLPTKNNFSPSAKNAYKRSGQELVDLTLEDSPTCKRFCVENSESNHGDETYRHILNGVVQTSPRFSSRSIATLQPTNYQLASPVPVCHTHPAALPITPLSPEHPPKPYLTIQTVPHQQGKGVMLSWNVQFNTKIHSKIVRYQLFAYQETSLPPSPSLWKKVGEDVVAMPLPMACTLSQFLPGHNYHFTVRAIDIFNRLGPFSDAKSIYLKI